MSAPNEPHSDYPRTVPELVTLREAARARNHDQVREILEGIAREDPGHLPAASETIGAVEGSEGWLEQQVVRDPGDWLARTLLAQRQIVMAWDARTARRASEVTDEQFREFRSLLGQAEQHLIRACAEKPAADLPWHLRLFTARGLELGVSEARRRYDRLAAHHPHHYAGQTNLLQVLLPKWAGSWELAEEFARSCASAPAGSASRAVVLALHLERWLGFDTEKEEQGYLTSDQVQADLATCSQELAEGAGMRPHAPQVHSLIAVLHSLAGRPQLAAPHFQALGDYVDGWVWGYLGGYAEKVNRIRITALAGGAR